MFDNYLIINKKIRNNKIKKITLDSIINSFYIKSFESSSNKLFKDFLRTPFFIRDYYSENTKKALPLISLERDDFKNKGKKHNPFFDNADARYFIVKMKNKNKEYPVGRIIAYYDHLYSEKGKKVGWIGSFESINNKYVAQLLFHKAEEYLLSLGVDTVIGPARFNANGEIGLLVKGFEYLPQLMEPYNPKYYEFLFINNGYLKVKNKWFSFNVSQDDGNKTIKRISQILEKKYNSHYENNRKYNVYRIYENFFQDNKDLIIRTIAKKKYKQELNNDINHLTELYNQEWDKGNHPEFRKLTEDEMNVLVNSLKGIAIEDLIYIAEIKDSEKIKNEIIGTMVNIPNLNETIYAYDSKTREKQRGLSNIKFLKYIDNKTKSHNLLIRDIKIYINMLKNIKNKNFSSIRTLIMGVSEKYRKKGIEGLMMNELYKVVTKKYKNIEYLSGSEIADINLDMINELKNIGSIGYEWNVYEKRLR